MVLITSKDHDILGGHVSDDLVGQETPSLTLVNELLKYSVSVRDIDAYFGHFQVDSIEALLGIVSTMTQIKNKNKNGLHSSAGQW